MRLAPGRSERVTFRLHPADDLGVFDEAAHRFVVVPGRYTLASARRHSTWPSASHSS